MTAAEVTASCITLVFTRLSFWIPLFEKPKGKKKQRFQPVIDRYPEDLNTLPERSSQHRAGAWATCANFSELLPKFLPKTRIRMRSFSKQKYGLMRQNLLKMVGDWLIFPCHFLVTHSYFVLVKQLLWTRICHPPTHCSSILTLLHPTLYHTNPPHSQV